MAIQRTEEEGIAAAEPEATAERDAWADIEKELFAEPNVRPRPRRRPSAAPPRRRLQFRPWMRPVVGGLALVACALLAWLILGGGERGERVSVRLTHSSPEEPVRTAALSADGERVAWVHSGALHVRSLNGASYRSSPLPDGMLVEHLTWTEDGAGLVAAARMHAGFHAGLWQLVPEGGPPRLLREDAHSPIASSGGRLAFVQQDTLGKSIWTMLPDGSQARPLFADDHHDYAHPAWSPDGQRLAFIRSSRDLIEVQLMTAPAGGGEPTEVAVDFDPETGPAWLDERTLIYGRPATSGASLWALELDDDWQPDGEPEELAQVENVSHLDRVQVGGAGRRIAFTAVSTRVDVYVAPLDDEQLTQPERLTSGTSDHWPVAWSAAGDALVLNVETGRDSEIVLHPVLGAGEPTRVGAGRVWAVTAGGDMLAGAADKLATRVLRLSHHGEPQLLGELPVHAIHSRNVFRCPVREGAGCVLGLKEHEVLYLHAFDPRRENGKGRLLAKVGLGERDYGWNLSPDGGNVAVVNGGRLIKLVDLRDGSVRKLTLKASVYTQDVAWADDGRALFVTGLIMHSAGGYVLYRVDLKGGMRELWRTDDRWFDEPVPSPDGKRLALASRTREADLWLYGEPPAATP